MYLIYPILPWFSCTGNNSRVLVGSFMGVSPEAIRTRSAHPGKMAPPQGMAADILEFSLESLKEQEVICNLLLIITILGILSWSLLQFTLVLTSVSAPRSRAAMVTRGKSCKGCFGCCENEIWLYGSPSSCRMDRSWSWDCTSWLSSTASIRWWYSSSSRTSWWSCCRCTAWPSCVVLIQTRHTLMWKSLKTDKTRTRVA